MHKGTWLQSQFVFHNGFRGIIENISFGCFTTLRRTTTTSHCRAPVAGTHKWKFQSANFSVHMSVHVFTLAHYRGELWLFHSMWLNAFYVHVRMRSMHYRMGCDRAIGMCIVVGIASAMVVDFSRCRSSFRRILFFFCADYSTLTTCLRRIWSRIVEIWSFLLLLFALVPTTVTSMAYVVSFPVSASSMF